MIRDNQVHNGVEALMNIQALRGPVPIPQKEMEQACFECLNAFTNGLVSKSFDMEYNR